MIRKSDVCSDSSLNIKNILMVGVGGQGIITASDILSEAALLAGFDVKKSEIHGMSQRGGSVFCHIRYGHKIFSPTIPKGKVDLLFSLEEIETVRWAEFCHDDTQVILSKTQILPFGVNEYPEGILQKIAAVFKNTLTIDPVEVNKINGEPKVLNTTLLGLLAKSLDIPQNAWLEAIQKLVPKGTYEINKKAFELGFSGNL